MLTKCKECGKELSSKATRCPNCGKPIGTSAARILMLLLAVAIGLVLFGGFRIFAN